MGKSSSKKKQNRGTQPQLVTGSSSEQGQSARLRTSFMQTCLHLLIVAIIGIIAYSNTFQAPFLFDDRAQIENNQMLRNLDNFWLALQGHNFGSGGYRYIPSRFLGYLSFALNYHFGGFEVRGYHLTNLVIHIFNAFLVYFFLTLTFKTPLMRKGPPLSAASGPGRAGAALIALFAALLFVSHPVQTQAVTYVVQRFASLATLFYLLSLVLYIRGRLGAMGNGQEAPPLNPPLVRGEVQGGHLPIPSRLWPIACYLLSLLSAVCAMKTKEISFTLPIVIILYEFVFFATPLKKKFLFLLPVVLTIVIVPLSIMHSGKPLGEILSDVSEMTRVQTQLPRWDYLMTEMRVITTYIRLIFVPIDQNLDYDYPIYHSLFTPPVFLSFLFLSTLFGTAVYLLYRSGQGARGHGQKAEDTPPSSPLSLGGEQRGVTSTQGKEPKTGGSPLPPPLSPSACYRLISFGILWFFITLSVESSVIPIADVIFEHRLYLPSVGFFTAIAAGVFLAAGRLKREKSMIPIIVVITLALSATTYARNNVWKDAASLWEDVVKNSPHRARPHDCLGVAYTREGHMDEAKGEFQAALRINPDYAEAHNNLGVVYGQQGRMDEAEREFQAAVRINPDYAEAHSNLGVVYRRWGRIDGAMREYQAALRINPDYADAHNNLGVVYRQLGRVDEAKSEFQTALRLNPGYAAARNNLEAVSQPPRRRLPQNYVANPSIP